MKLREVVTGKSSFPKIIDDKQAPPANMTQNNAGF